MKKKSKIILGVCIVAAALIGMSAVSYTHLTLPTTNEV